MHYEIRDDDHMLYSRSIAYSFVAENDDQAIEILKGWYTEQGPTYFTPVVLRRMSIAKHSLIAEAYVDLTIVETTFVTYPLAIHLTVQEAA